MINRAFEAAHVSDLQSHALRQRQIKDESDQLYIRLFDDVQRRLLESGSQETIDRALDELVLALRANDELSGTRLEVVCGDEQASSPHTIAPSRPVYFSRIFQAAVTPATPR